jgi:F0F1-type ATP synthase membrane subunit c/vacuolar-type H+-ATPase subunit K
MAQDLARTPASFKNHFLRLVLGEAIMIFVFTIVFASGAGAGEDDTGNDCFEP